MRWSFVWEDRYLIFSPHLSSCWLSPSHSKVTFTPILSEKKPLQNSLYLPLARGIYQPQINDLDIHVCAKIQNYLYDYHVWRREHLFLFKLTLLPWTKWYSFRRIHFRCIFVNEKRCILIQISSTFVFKDPVNNNPALVYKMVWRRIGDKPSSKPTLALFTDAYMRH